MHDEHIYSHVIIIFISSSSSSSWGRPSNNLSHCITLYLCTSHSINADTDVIVIVIDGL